MTDVRRETDSLGVVDVPADKLWGAQTQRSLEHFSIGQDLIPREMIAAYAILKKAAATANHASTRLDQARYALIVQTCDEILAGQHRDMFPLHVWMTGSGTQFNMNANEVISNRCCQLAGTPLGSNAPVHPNRDHCGRSDHRRKFLLPECIRMNFMMAGMPPVMSFLMMGRDMRAMVPTELVVWGVMSVLPAHGRSVLHDRALAMYGSEQV